MSELGVCLTVPCHHTMGETFYILLKIKRYFA